MKSIVFGLLFCAISPFAARLALAQEVPPEEGSDTLQIVDGANPVVESVEATTPSVSGYDPSEERIKLLEEKIKRLEEFLKIEEQSDGSKVLTVSKYGLLNQKRLTIRGEQADVVIQPDSGGMWIVKRVNGKSDPTKAIAIQLNGELGPFISMNGPKQYQQPGADVVMGTNEEGVAFFQIRQPDGAIIRFPKYEPAPVQGAPPVQNERGEMEE